MAMLISSGAFASDGVAPVYAEGRYQNPWGTNINKNLWSLLKWKLAGGAQEWPKKVAFEFRELPAKPQSGAVITWINHATFLIQLPNLNVLIDPVWSERVSPFSWIGPKRVHTVGLAWEKLPKIDLVLISHNHYDHLDLATLVGLEKRDAPQFLVPLGDLALLSDQGIKRIVEMTWWQEFKLGNVVVTFTPAQHWSSRWSWDRNKSLWGGWWLQEGQTQLLPAGHTGLRPHFKMIREKLGTPTLVMIPIGAYEPRWFMKDMHMNPSDAVEAVIDLGTPHQAVAMHFGTFPLSDEGHETPALDLKAAIEKRKLTSQFLVPAVGQSFTTNGE